MIADASSQSPIARQPTSWKDDLVVVEAHDFDLCSTLECGQVFHWARCGAGYVGMIGDAPIYVEQQGDRLLCPSGSEAAVAHYFGLDQPLAEICATFPQDAVMQEALAFCPGLRVIRQPHWECLATFLTSSMKQVTHIAQMSHAIRRRYGRAFRVGEETLYTYPTPAELALATEEELRACSLGYRAKNLLGTARMIAAGELDLEQVQALPPEQALLALCRLPGVGVKVAHCALLFAFGHLGAFPIDVWMERVLRERFCKGRRKPTAAQLQEYARTYFGPYGGYAQQYLFHHIRKTWQRPKPKAKHARTKPASVA